VPQGKTLAPEERLEVNTVLLAPMILLINLPKEDATGKNASTAMAMFAKIK